jgi:pimeloyl-ACP methyl ester carboxylesterase
MFTIINKQIQINGRQIYCQVQFNGEGYSLESLKDRPVPVVLVLPGGPGYSADSIKPVADALTDCVTILFDPLGCGRSDPAQDYNHEYSIDNFTEIAAQVVEAVKQETHIPFSDLRIIGSSFGSFLAMNFPVIRPQWLEENDTGIQIKQIIS